jgi:hypothetical protein
MEVRMPRSNYRHCLRSNRRILFAVVVLAALPFAVAGNSVRIQQACAEGTCCPEYQSICNIGGGDHINYYKKAGDGSCRS